MWRPHSFSPRRTIPKPSAGAEAAAHAEVAVVGHASEVARSEVVLAPAAGPMGAAQHVWAGGFQQALGPAHGHGLGARSVRQMLCPSRSRAGDGAVCGGRGADQLPAGPALQEHCAEAVFTFNKLSFGAPSHMRPRWLVFAASLLGGGRPLADLAPANRGAPA